jgi:hypothetical protein
MYLEKVREPRLCPLQMPVHRVRVLVWWTFILIHYALLSSLPFDSPTPGDLDRGGKVEATDLEGDQDLVDDSTGDEEGAGRQVTSSRIRERVATEITGNKNRQRKYHTKKSAQRSKGGRVKGSKAKNSVKEQVASAGWF